MTGKTSGFIFLGICLILALLLLTKIITFLISSAIFAAVLVVLGLASRGFKK